ncbi:E3 ubiquitin-protein ligase SH3RF2 isoform X3 [Parus major]|uniref:E3 ubiquitin-protein ligase SH3RF2 isoform X3 n=1 Tax=Parus major TaxID=9157 RepID=UPI00077112E6|nr:E3 ubiquitin-protein ligase SH3RF2 isoform X3 [Parus major]
MDDLALLDLLECPVCFEKLDATAKVLPCQHTFCKPCLQRILKSQKELRCPECRTLVLGSIEQLPSNLLLIRLLDGVRCGQNVTRFGSIQRSGVLSSPASIRRVPRGLQLHQHRLATNPRLHMEGVPRARALYTYRGHNPGELRFNKGDTIILLRQLDENWYLGELNGISGVFPASSVQVIKHLPLPRPLYSLDLRGRATADSKDILTFQKPSSPAQQLLQASKSHWSPQSKGASLQTASPKAKAADSAAFPKVPDSRRKSLRQFSITTALNTLNRMVHSPTDRPALEISSPVLISSSNPSVATQSSEKAEPPYGTPLQVSTSYYPSPGPLGSPAAIVTLPHLQQHGPAYLCVALHSYTAQAPDELELQKGEGVRVFGKDQDGWLRGMSLVTGRVGLFPSNYVTPLFSRKSSLSDSKMPSLYTSWTLSTSSLSSQGSVSEKGPRQSRALRPLLLPVPVPAPGRTAGAPAPLRRGRGSSRKSECSGGSGGSTATHSPRHSGYRVPQPCLAPTLAALGIPGGFDAAWKNSFRCFVQSSVFMLFPRRLQGLSSSHTRCFVVHFREYLGKGWCVPSPGSRAAPGGSSALAGSAGRGFTPAVGAGARGWARGDPWELQPRRIL